jgi:hypothetical protein
MFFKNKSPNKNSQCPKNVFANWGASPHFCKIKNVVVKELPQKDMFMGLLLRR